MQTEALLALIEEIYESAVDPVRWMGTLTRVSEALGCRFMSIVPYADPDEIIMSKGAETAMEGYRGHWSRHDTMVKVGIRNRHFTGLVCDWSAIGIAEMARDPYYQEYRRDNDLGHCIGSTFQPVEGEFTAIGLNYGYGEAPLEPIALRQVETVLRHMTRALKVSARMPDRDRDRQTLVETIARVQCAAAILDHDARLLLVNAAFERLADDGLRVVDGRLRCADRNSQRGLERTIRGGDPLREDDRGGIAFIARPSGRRALMSRAVRLAREGTIGLSTAPRSGARKLLLVVDLDAESVVTSEVALRSLGLTVAEARVAAMVGGGRSSRETAASLGVTEGTVRSHLKHVFSKTEVSRQSELTRLVQALSVLEP